MFIHHPFILTWSTIPCIADEDAKRAKISDSVQGLGDKRQVCISISCSSDSITNSEITMVLVILHWQFLIKMALLIHKLDWTHSLVEKCRWTKHWLPWATKVERSFQSWRDTKFDTKILPGAKYFVFFFSVPSKREKNILVLLSLFIFWGKCVYFLIFFT